MSSLVKKSPSRFWYVVTWPTRKLRLWVNECPWCGRDLQCSRLLSGTLHMRSGKVRYCTYYHYFESTCLFGWFDHHKNDWRDVRRVRVRYDDRHGDIPEEAKQVIDAQIYALHRVVLHEHCDDVFIQELRDKTVDAAIRSCETLMDRLLDS